MNRRISCSVRSKLCELGHSPPFNDNNRETDEQLLGNLVEGSQQGENKMIEMKRIQSLYQLINNQEKGTAQ